MSAIVEETHPQKPWPVHTPAILIFIFLSMPFEYLYKPACTADTAHQHNMKVDCSAPCAPHETT